MEPYEHPAPYVRAFFEGSVKGAKAAYSWVVLTYDNFTEDSPEHWRRVAWKSEVLPDGATITAAELEAASSVIAFLQAYYHGYQKALLDITAKSHMDYSVIRTLTLADLMGSGERSQQPVRTGYANR